MGPCRISCPCNTHERTQLCGTPLSMGSVVNWYNFRAFHVANLKMANFVPAACKAGLRLVLGLLRHFPPARFFRAFLLPDEQTPFLTSSDPEQPDIFKVIPVPRTLPPESLDPKTRQAFFGFYRVSGFVLEGRLLLKTAKAVEDERLVMLRPGSGLLWTRSLSSPSLGLQVQVSKQHIL